MKLPRFVLTVWLFWCVSETVISYLTLFVPVTRVSHKVNFNICNLHLISYCIGFATYQTDSNYKISFSSRESTKQSKPFLNNMLRGTTIILLDERRRLRKQHWLVVAAAATAFIVVLAVLAQPVTALDYTGNKRVLTHDTL